MATITPTEYLNYADRTILDAALRYAASIGGQVKYTKKLEHSNSARLIGKPIIYDSHGNLHKLKDNRSDWNE